MSLQMLADAAAAIPDPVGLVLAGVTGLVLVYWTYRRVVGDGTDPSIALSTGGTGGSASFLVSGFVAVVFVAVGMVLGLGEQIAEQPAILLIPGAFVAAHLYVEVRES